MSLVSLLACILLSALYKVWKQFTYLHEIWCQCHAIRSDYMLCLEKLGILVTLFTQRCEFEFSSCFTGYVQLKNALSHREVASCEGDYILITNMMH